MFDAETVQNWAETSSLSGKLGRQSKWSSRRPCVSLGMLVRLAEVSSSNSLLEQLPNVPFKSRQKWCKKVHKSGKKVRKKFKKSSIGRTFHTFHTPLLYSSHTLPK